MDWLWWVGGALLLGILEMLMLDLVFIMFAGGALAGGLANLLGAELWLQVVVAAVTSAVLLFALRPWLLHRLRDRTQLVETNTAALVGRPAVVVSTVTGEGGRVKLAGEVWSARAAAGVSIPPGVSVRVDRIDGATAVVAPTDAA
ncbi:NfeD family protein [Cellulomonas composti]|uniref:Membrane protein n=1 Tax=Cellulomonas composti TaxID=266130 RepID=A0A511J5V7_9CELL|nr:NfeD family protein [Cellulomonas composti]GEL93390.1 membrane protein [Cellulomonas composti]